jgi:hypothetical protein
MDANVSHEPCSCPSFKILYISTSGTEACTALRENLILD